MVEHIKSGNLLLIVEKILLKKDKFLNTTKKHPTPFYVYDQKGVDESIEVFTTSFRKHITNFQPYYAVKLNHHPFIVNRVVEKGMGLDVASIRELNIALKARAEKIVYYSPAKSEDDLEYILRYADKVRIHIDSFNELHLLGELTSKLKIKIEAGIRIHTPAYGLWTKYGIPLQSLRKFWKEASKYPFLKLNGIHFHQSRNKTVSFYVNTIHALASYLKNNFTTDQLSDVAYIDFGGGFEPYESEGIIVWKGSHWPKYKILDTPTIEEYARAISNSIKKYLDPIINATYLSEPGRYICNNVMHIVLSVADIKDKENCILNGGVNMVGWQRFEKEYFPLVNITHPSKAERRCRMWGNLCTTWDTWGYYYHGSKLQEKDIVVIPYQGALTYSLAQTFINNIPAVYSLK
jgi:diaminopimelate decarboxylase